MNSRYFAVAFLPVWLTGCAVAPMNSNLTAPSALDSLEWQALAKTLKVDPNRANKSQILYDLAKRELQLDRTHEAARLFKLALQFESNHVDSMNGLASVLFQQQKYDESQAIILVALKYDPDNALLQKNLGRIKGAIAATQTLPAPEANLTSVAQTRQIRAMPAVIDLSRPLNDQPAIPVTERQIEILPLMLAGGFERVLNSSQLTEISPNVYELIASGSAQVVANLPPSKAKLNAKTLSEQSMAPAPILKLRVLSRQPVPKNTPEPSQKTIKSWAVPLLRTTYEKKSYPSLLVSNGMGKPGIACGQARAVKFVAALNVSCADYKDFKQKQTLLFVREGATVSIDALAKLSALSGSVKVIRVSRLPNNLDMHLVLGKDFSVGKWIKNRA
jgi:hypothetical protein